jgi:hypothetical protein
MKGKLTETELQLRAALQTDADSFEDFFDNADQPAVQAAASLPGSNSGKPEMARSKYNPVFKAQFDVSISIKYFEETAAGVYAARTAAQIIAAVATTTQFPVFLFGFSDFEAGYKQMAAEFPVAGGWAYGQPFIFGRDVARCSFSNFDANVTGVLQRGDLVLPYTITTATPTNYVAIVIIRCKQVAYSALLSATNSDKFVLNMIRYVVAAAYVDQYNNDIKYINQSLFGKRTSDSWSPTSYKNPEQQQDGIIDIPIKIGINKEVALGTFIDYDKVLIQWSIFVWTVKKV